jgi:hypothetical protein
MSPEAHEKISQALKGRVMTDEQKAKLRVANTGRLMSRETKNKIRASLLKRYGKAAPPTETPTTTETDEEGTAEVPSVVAEPKLHKNRRLIVAQHTWKGGQDDEDTGASRRADAEWERLCSRRCRESLSQTGRT